MKILITGGLGYIGSHTVVELIESGYTPVIVDNLSNSYAEVQQWIADITGVTPEVHHVDCTDLPSFRKVFAAHPDLQGAIHFAAYKAVGESVKQPLKYYQNNLTSLLNLLQLMQEFNVPHLVFSSSCTVYGSPENSIQVSESTPLQQPQSPYGHTKWMSEQMVMDVASTHGLKASILRYFNPIGAHPSAKIGELPIGEPNNLVPYITQTAIGLRPVLSVFGHDYDTPDGTCIRDYIHVCDLALAHVKAIDYLQQQSDHVSVFNLGTAAGNSVKEVIETFEKVSGKPLHYQYAPRRKGDVPAIYADASKAQQHLQWQCRYSLEESLRTAWNWQKQLQEKQLNNQHS